VALQLGALRSALVEAGSSEATAAAAAEEAASYETRLGAIDAKLTVALWAGGLLFAAILTSQAALWIALGKIDGNLAQIGGQVTHIEQLVGQR
jgi:hypothetical protein